MMKNQWPKRMLIISLSGILLGGICTGAGIALGGSPVFYVNAEGIHVKEEQKPEDMADYQLESTETGALENICIDMAEADIKIVSGETFLVEYVLNGQRFAPEYSVSDGTLTLTESGRQKSRPGFSFFGGTWGTNAETVSPYVQVTVPQKASLSEMELSNVYGDIRIDTGINAKNLTVRSEYGEVQMEDWRGENFDLEMENGSFSGDNLSGRNVDMRSVYGDVSIGGLKADTAGVELKYGELEAGVEKPGSFDIRNGNGGIFLLLNGSKKDYGLNLYTEYGSIHAAGRTVHPDEDGGASYTGMGAGQAALYADTEYGDITVREIKR